MNKNIWKILWWLCLVVAPVILLTVELFHPSGFTKNPGMYAYLSVAEPYDPKHVALAYHGPESWFLLHMIQTPMVGLVAVGLWLLVARVTETDGAIAIALAWLSRAATFVFLIYYTALDAIGGFGLGRTLINAKGLIAAGSIPQSDVKSISLLLDTAWKDAWTGGVGSFISLTGSWAIFVATLSAALALYFTRKISWPPLLLLVGFGWELQVSHASPHGPIAFSLLLMAALWIWWEDYRSGHSATTS